jgi:hypothetical protein
MKWIVVGTVSRNHEHPRASQRSLMPEPGLPCDGLLAFPDPIWPTARAIWCPLVRLGRGWALGTLGSSLCGVSLTGVLKLLIQFLGVFPAALSNLSPGS